ncbi:MAG TPA: serine hydrolase [Vicinamibacterales bacterium]|nr:serine hydrolase [Vicinamibacterales bacterium]
MTRRSLLVLLATLVAAWSAPAALRAQPDPLAGLDAALAKAVQDWRVTGLAVAVVKDGAVAFSKGYGVRELGKPGLVNDHTLFAIGSTTKAMTAALIGMLVDEKKLAWDDPVTKHLPWFELSDPYLTREITVRDLLTHRAGLGNADYLWYGQPTEPRDILRRVRLLPPAYSLRSSFIYQNVMYAAAGAVVEAVGGRPWADMMRTRIFEPLGMSDTIATAATLSAKPNVALPHWVIDGTVTRIENASVDGVAPAGSVWSSVSDMAKWSAMLLAGGKAGSLVLLSPATLEELFKPQTMVTAEAFYPTARLTKPKWTTYGLGWFQQDYRGRAADYHTGSIDGMVAIHGLLRDQGVGVIVLANLDHAELRHAIMLDVFDRYIGAARRDWSTDLRALYNTLQTESEAERRKVEASRVAGTTPSLQLAGYAGTYSDPLYGDVVVTLEGNRLLARYGSAFVGALEHWHYDTFRATWDAAWRGTELVTFVLDAKGQASRLEMLGARFTRAR